MRISFVRRRPKGWDVEGGTRADDGVESGPTNETRRVWKYGGRLGRPLATKPSRLIKPFLRKYSNLANDCPHQSHAGVIGHKKTVLCVFFSPGTLINFFFLIIIFHF